MPFTKQHKFEQGGTWPAATVPSDMSNMWIYTMKISNEGGSVHGLRVSQKRNANAFDDVTTVPANSHAAWGLGRLGNRLLNFQSGGTIVAALDTAQGAGAGTLDVTLDINTEN